jgi:hypothetical protein
VGKADFEVNSFGNVPASRLSAVRETRRREQTIGWSIVSRFAFRSPTTTSIVGERLPYHQIAQTRRARCDRGKCRANSYLRENKED